MYYQFHNYIRVPIVRVYRDTSMDVMYSKTNIKELTKRLP